MLIASATGGSAFNAAGAYLADEAAMGNLRGQLPADPRGFPYVEALVQVKGRSAQPSDAKVVVCRRAR